jgi:site-specific recombinase XerD
MAWYQRDVAKAAWVPLPGLTRDEARTVLVLKSSWKYDLEARNHAPRTITDYLISVDRFAMWCGSQDLKLRDITKSHMRAWLTFELSRIGAKTVVRHYNGVRAWFKWLLAEGEIAINPCIGVPQPSIPEKVVEVPEQRDIKLLLKTTGADLIGVRDATIIMVLADAGLRASELIGLRLCDVDLENGALLVTGKFRRQRMVPVGRKTVGQIARYLRKRPESHAEAPFWVSARGNPLTDSGLRQMLDRRCTKAGISHLHPHMFRRFFAVSWLSEGGTETGLMTVCGWRGTHMVKHYSGNKSASLAAKEHRRLSPGDRL